MIDKISLIGLGAIGTAYAGRLCNALPPENIRVIAGGARAERIRKEGIFLNGTPYTFPVVAPEEPCEPAGLLIFATKFQNLREAAEQAANHVGEDTVILSLINGIGSEEILMEFFGREKVLYSVNVGIDAVKVGNRVESGSIGTTYFGEAVNREGAYPPKVQAVKALFDRAGIRSCIPPDMIRQKWYKFMINVALNQITAVFQADYGVMQNVNDLREMMVKTMREVVLVAQKLGIALGEQDVQGYLEILAKGTPSGCTSMCQDVRAGRPTENEILGEYLAQLARKLQVDTPTNNLLVKIIRGLDAKARFLRAHPAPSGTA